MAGNVLPITIEHEMRQSYMDYAMSVIVGRALPDVRDGLKPVQRRVLYAMFVKGHLPGKKHSKCAGVVGDVLGKYHPHGDLPVYEALVRLAQPWNLRYPLVDGQGNFGSIDGDPPAAYRYTECRMTEFAAAMLEDIDKETVDFAPNFDDTTEEPTVLPSVVPNLLVNGASGIAVGMATHMPPHNLREVIDGAIAVIRQPSITVDELLKIIPGPDFPTGGIICGSAAIRSAYRTGRGVITVRGKTHVERVKTTSREAEAIVITEIPYQVNKTRLIERIAELINQKEIDGVARLRDESDRSGMRIVIELKREAKVDVVLNHLYRSTPLQDSFGITNLAIVEGKPVVCTLLQLLQAFVDHRRDVVTRRTQFELRQARARIHILEGFKVALLNLDEVIALIRGSETPAEARDALIGRFSLSAVQAQAILDLKLQKLTGLERLAIEREHDEIRAEIERLTLLLSDAERMNGCIIAELERVRDRFADSRRTELLDAVLGFVDEDFIEDREMTVTISHQGFVKRTPLSEYRAQRRGGKGIAVATTTEDDGIEHIFVASELTDIMIFTSMGRLFFKKVYELPEAGRTARGRALVNLLELREGERATAVLPVRKAEEEKFVVMATRFGVVKKVRVRDFSRLRKGVIACSLDEGDSLIGVQLSDGSHDVVLVSRSGLAIRFHETQVRAMGRVARGVRGISLAAEDEVVSMAVVSAAGDDAGRVDAEPGDETTGSGEAGDWTGDGVERGVGECDGVESDQESLSGPGGDGPFLVTVCENGFGKRTPLSLYRVTRRGGKGIIDIRTGERNGRVVASCVVVGSEELMLITSGGKVIRFLVAELPSRGRGTMGVKVVDLESGEKVVTLAAIVESEGELPQSNEDGGKSSAEQGQGGDGPATIH